MGRRDRDRDYVPWGVYFRGLTATERVCTRCGSDRMSRSHTPFGWLGRTLRLVAMRCWACAMKFALRADLAGRREMAPER